ncbi:MAG: hypothetical protein MZU79_03055 [Anaerotruncus sp.]|nr:hypothetical protein [Anaerotruncus sp.]
MREVFAIDGEVGQDVVFDLRRRFRYRSVRSLQNKGRDLMALSGAAINDRAVIGQEYRQRGAEEGDQTGRNPDFRRLLRVIKVEHYRPK